MVSNIKIEAISFRAWRSGEKEYDNLCTVILPEGITIFTDIEIFEIFMAQNGLRNLGEYGKPSFTNKDSKGFRKLTFGVSLELAKELMSLKGLAGIGGYTVKISIE